MVLQGLRKKELKKILVELNILILRWCFYNMNHAYKICTSLTPSATPQHSLRTKMSDSKHRKRRKRSAGSSKTSKAPQAPLLFSNFGKKPLGLFNLMLLVNFGGCPVLFFLLDCFFFFSLSHNSRSVDQESWNFPLSLSLNSRNSLQG